MPKKSDFKNLRTCLDKYTPNFLYIRLVGSRGGTVKINESLEGKTLDFKKDKSGLYFLIDKKEAFHFSLNDYYANESNGFSLAYERFHKDGRMVMLPTGENPDDSSLPYPNRSFLRHVIDHHLLEIFFPGKIPLEFHSWWEKPYWKVV